MNYLSLAYWFNSRPEPLSSQTLKYLLILVVLLLVLSLAMYLKSFKFLKFSKKITNSIISFSLTNAFIAILMVFFNYELIPFFRSRYIYVIWIAMDVYWLYKIFFYRKKNTHIIVSSERDEEIKKYLPN
jgi:hypothetical protein